jgi:hypothetical protein
MTKIRRYLAEIGSRGGRTSRRALRPEAARDMVRVREARRAFRRYHQRCFASHAPDLTITIAEVPWVAEQLLRFGDNSARATALRLVSVPHDTDVRLDPSRRAMLIADLALSPTERVVAAERTADEIPRRKFAALFVSFDREEDYQEWKRLEHLGLV